MKKITFLFLIIILAHESNSQWVEIHQDSTLLEIQDLHFFNNDTGVVCGQIQHGEGFVLRTVDGGATWINSVSLLSICTYLYFLNDSVGYTGGQDGVIYKTADGGISWNYCCNSGVPVDVDGLYCFNDSVWLTNRYGGQVLKTTDFGSTWLPVAYTITSNYGIPYFYERSINPFHFLTDSIGFVVGHGVFKTFDLGNTWLRMHADTSYYLRAITMKNPIEGFAVGNDGIILKTFDGGINWSLDSISEQDLRDIRFINNMEGYCVGGGFGYFNDTTGVVLKTIDGGISWTATEISRSRLNAIQIIDSVGFAVGNYGQIFKYEIAAIAPFDSTQNLPDQLLVYPNPASDEITLSGSVFFKSGIVSISDLSGRLVMSKSFSDQHSNTVKLVIDNFETGMYIVNIASGNINISSKFIKE